MKIDIKLVLIGLLTFVGIIGSLVAQPLSPSNYGMLLPFGPYDLNGSRLTLDLDADSYIQNSTDDTISFFTSGGNRVNITSASTQFLHDVRVENASTIRDAFGVLEMGGACTATVAGTADTCFGTDVEVQGFLVIKKLAADPCGTDPEGSIFYNTTADILCLCNGAGADVKVSDGTACF